MQNYMTKLNNIKKYILPFLFLVMTFVMIPKAAYYKKENITIKVETTGDENTKGHIYITYPKGYQLEEPYFEFKNKSHKQIKNVVAEKYYFKIWTKDIYFKKISFNNFEKIIDKNKRIVELGIDDIKGLYKISFVNILVSFIVSILMILYFFRAGIKISKESIGVFIVGLIFLSLGINFSWLSKMIGLFFSITFGKIIIEKRKYGKIEVILLMLLILSFIIEFFAFKNYKEAYDYFQNSLIFILCIKIWNFNFKDKEILKKMFRYTLILLGIINLISPLFLGGIYLFTFSVLMSILCLDSLQNLLEIKNLKKLDIFIETISLFIGLCGILEGSRRTMLVVIVVYGLYISIKKKIFKNKKLLISLLVGLFVIIFILNKAVPKKLESFEKRISTIFTIKEDKSSYQRILMWRRGYYMLKENPILGIGANSFYKESIKGKYDNIKLKDEKFSEDFIHVHNEYIHQIITRGIPGAILFYGLWIYILSRLRKSKDKDFDIMLLIIYGVYGIFDPYSIRAESIVFYTFIGISFVNCLPVVEKENKILQKLGYISTVIIFLIALYFNKRFRYYFLILLFIYIGYYFYNKRKREKYERI